jgi:hypothetical protein
MAGVAGLETDSAFLSNSRKYTIMLQTKGHRTFPLLTLTPQYTQNETFESGNVRNDCALRNPAQPTPAVLPEYPTKAFLA